MAAIDWPATLPQSFQQSSYNKNKMKNVIQTEMDSGPPKVRRRFTAVPIYHSGSIILTSAQLVIFETFFDDTILSGTEPFNFPDPTNLASSIEVEWEANDPPYSVVPDGGTLDWSVSFTLRTVP